MSKNKKADDRKQLLIRYRILEDGKVNFIDPCCDEIPAVLLGKVMEAISKIEKEWNNEVTPNPTIKDITSEKECPYKNSLSCILAVVGTCDLCSHNQ